MSCFQLVLIFGVSLCDFVVAPGESCSRVWLACGCRAFWEKEM